MIDYKRTAIKRGKPSRPLKDLLFFLEDNNMNPKDFLWFDYGCGRGDDVKHLVDSGATAFGWDPHWNSDGIAFKHMDIVTCTYVLCVLDEIQDRIDCIQTAWEKVNDKDGTLAIFVRTKEEIDAEAIKNNWTQYNDGYITKNNTFQKGYRYGDLNALVTAAIPYNQCGMVADFSKNGYVGMLLRKTNSSNLEEPK